MYKQLYFLTIAVLLVLTTNGLKYENSTTSNIKTSTNGDHFEELIRETDKLKTECKSGSSNEDKSEPRHIKLNDSSNSHEKSSNSEDKEKQDKNASSQSIWNGDKTARDGNRDTSGQHSSNSYNSGDYHNPYYNYDAHKTNDNGGYSDLSSSRNGNSRSSDYNLGTPYSFGYTNDGFIRTKRSHDIECISQCVFGYLEVLDDNRSPSEYALIKWLQDHLPSDEKRIKAIREIRKCFARYAASDNEDSCSFSKSLSNCLNLGLEN